MIAIGFIGAGGIARDRHIPGLRKIDGVKLAAVANRTRASGERAAAEHGFERVYEDWRQHIEDPAIDAVFICAQPYMHREMTLYALEHGKHVFCQARMAMDHSDALRMAEADRRTALTTMLCPAPHYMAAAPFVQAWLAEGRLGNVRHVALVHPNAAVLLPETPLFWRQRADLQGINILDVGMTAEVMNVWFGEVDQLSAVSRIWVKERPADGDGRTKVDLPDALTLIGEFRSGATLTALYSGAVQGGAAQMTIYGDKGTLTCYPFEGHVRWNDGSGDQILDIPHSLRGEWRAEEAFVEAIRNGYKGSPSFEDGLRYMAFSQAVTDSLVAGGHSIALRRG